MMSEIKMWQSGMSVGSVTAGAPMPTSVSTICGYGATITAGQAVTANTGHTEWGDSKDRSNWLYLDIPPPIRSSGCVNPADGFTYDFDYAEPRHWRGAVDELVPTYRRRHVAELPFQLRELAVRGWFGPYRHQRDPDPTVWQGLADARW